MSTSILGHHLKLTGMWGSLAKSAQALAAVAAEQAQKGLASANQLLEKLDGQLDDEDEDGEEGEDDDKNYNEDGSRKEVKRDNDEQLKQKTLVGSEQIGITNDQSKVDLDETVSDREETWFTPMKQPERRQSVFDMKPEDAIHEAGDAIDDEIDDLLFEDDNADDVINPTDGGAVIAADVSSQKNIPTNPTDSRVLQNESESDSQLASDREAALKMLVKVR